MKNRIEEEEKIIVVEINISPCVCGFCVFPLDCFFNELFYGFVVAFKGEILKNNMHAYLKLHHNNILFDTNLDYDYYYYYCCDYEFSFCWKIPIFN